MKRIARNKIPCQDEENSVDVLVIANRDEQSIVQTASHWRVNTYSALSFDRLNYFNIVHLHFDFTFNEKPV